jgi:predicted nucleic acid-binding protein
MLKIFLDTNILVNLAVKANKDYKKLVFGLITAEFPNLSVILISDLVFNETHAFLTNKADIN